MHQRSYLMYADKCVYSLKFGKCTHLVEAGRVLRAAAFIPPVSRGFSSSIMSRVYIFLMAFLFIQILVINLLAHFLCPSGYMMMYALSKRDWVLFCFL